MLYTQSIEILSKVIMDDAYREAEAIIDKAKKETESIRRKESHEFNIMFFKNKNCLYKVLLYNNKEKVISLEEFKSRSDILTYKETVVQEILQHIKRAFYSLPENQDYPKILKKLIIQALRHLDPDGQEFICRINQRDHGLLSSPVLKEVGKKMNKALFIDDFPVNIVGGVIVLRYDLRVLYDNSLEAVFERNRQTMRYMAAECIFGKG